VYIHVAAVFLIISLCSRDKHVPDLILKISFWRGYRHVSDVFFIS